MHQRKGGNGAGQECSLAVIGGFAIVIGDVDKASKGGFEIAFDLADLDYAHALTLHGTGPFIGESRILPKTAGSHATFRVGRPPRLSNSTLT